MQAKPEQKINISLLDFFDWMIILIILFCNFGIYKYDLYDVIYNSLLKAAGL